MNFEDLVLFLEERNPGLNGLYEALNARSSGGNGPIAADNGPHQTYNGPFEGFNGLSEAQNGQWQNQDDGLQASNALSPGFNGFHQARDAFTIDLNGVIQDSLEGASLSFPQRETQGVRVIRGT